MQCFLTPSCLSCFRRELNCAHYRAGRAGLRLGLLGQQCPAPSPPTAVQQVWDSLGRGAPSWTTLALASAVA